MIEGLSVFGYQFVSMLEPSSIKDLSVFGGQFVAMRMEVVGCNEVPTYPTLAVRRGASRKAFPNGVWER